MSKQWFTQLPYVEKGPDIRVLNSSKWLDATGTGTRVDFQLSCLTGSSHASRGFWELQLPDSAVTDVIRNQLDSENVFRGLVYGHNEDELGEITRIQTNTYCA